MNWLDLVIIGILAWFALAGLSAGILRESVTLLGAILGVIVAGLLYRQLADDFSIFTDNQTAQNIAAFAAIFFSVFLAGQIAAMLLKRVASLLLLGPLDHLAGLAFGLMKGFVLVEAALIVLTRYRVDTLTRAMDGSLLTPVFLDGLPILLTILPREFRQAVEEFP
jgi:membrane protein required for colicin V production